MITKSSKAQMTAFYVKLDDDGKRFIDSLRRHLNRGEYRLRLQGRSEDRSNIMYNRASRVPLSKATYVAVYLEGKTTTRVTQQHLSELYNREPIIKYVNKPVPWVHLEIRKVSWSTLWSDFKQLWHQSWK